LNVYVDTSVWSLALRRDDESPRPEIGALIHALQTGTVFTTGLVLQELLQGFPKAQSKARIITSFAALPMLVLDRDDHIQAAELRDRCRKRGIQMGTIDALLAHLCVRHDLAMLTTDHDFARVAELTQMAVWRPVGG
jgi:predicted nucleic acid-binding protein